MKKKIFITVSTLLLAGLFVCGFSIFFDKENPSDNILDESFDIVPSDDPSIIEDLDTPHEYHPAGEDPLSGWENTTNELIDGSAILESFTFDTEPVTDNSLPSHGFSSETP